MGARETALNALIACRKSGAWSNTVLKEYIARDRLPPRDAALATRLCYGVLQNRKRGGHIRPGAPLRRSVSSRCRPGAVLHRSGFGRTGTFGRVQPHGHGRLGIECGAQRRPLFRPQLRKDACGEFLRQRHASLSVFERIEARTYLLQHRRVGNEILMVFVDDQHIAFVDVVDPVVILVVQTLEV